MKPGRWHCWMFFRLDKRLSRCLPLHSVMKKNRIGQPDFWVYFLFVLTVLRLFPHILPFVLQIPEASLEIYTLALTFDRVFNWSHVIETRPHCNDIICAFYLFPSPMSKTEIKPIHQIIDVTSDCVYVGPIYICTPISDMDLSRD